MSPILSAEDVMPTLSLLRLRRLLNRIGHVELATPVRPLLDILEQRDHAMLCGDRLETIMQQSIGSPGLFVEIGSQLRHVTSHQAIGDLLQGGVLSFSEAERLTRRLARRQHQWSEQSSTLGLRALRRRERRLAARSRKVATQLLRHPASARDQVLVKLAILGSASTVEPALIEVVLDDLNRLQ